MLVEAQNKNPLDGSGSVFAGMAKGLHGPRLMAMAMGLVVAAKRCQDVRGRRHDGPIVEVCIHWSRLGWRRPQAGNAEVAGVAEAEGFVAAPRGCVRLVGEQNAVLRALRLHPA